MLTNAFDDLIEDESDLESTVDRTRNSEAMGSILTGQSGIKATKLFSLYMLDPFGWL